jgi:hypothetical protein
MKKHPGIWFSLWTIETLFLLSLWFGLIEAPRVISGSILFLWCAICTYWVVVFHVRWIMKIDEKFYKKYKEEGK